MSVSGSSSEFTEQEKPLQQYISLALVLVIFALLSSITYLWELEGYKVLPSGKYIAGPLAILGLLAFLKRSKNWHDYLPVATSAGGIGLMLVFISDWLCREHNLIQGPAIRGELLGFAVLAYLLKASGLTRRLIIFLPVVCALTLGFIFFSESSGRLLFSDDHSTFYYRLLLLKDNFPLIPFYNPQWNAGLDARDAFATGALALFTLSLPWVYIFKLSSIYNILIAVILFLLNPLFVYLAARIARANRLAASVAAVLILTSSLHWYRWALKYGTMGFVLGAICAPLVIILFGKLFTKEKLTSWEFILLLLTLSLMLLWPFYGFVLTPLFLLAGYRCLQRWIVDRHNFWSFFKQPLLFMLLAGALHLPWMLTFVGSSGLDRFLGADRAAQESESVEGQREITKSEPAVAKAPRFKHRKGSIDLAKSLRAVRIVSFASNPILIFFSISGLFLMPLLYRRSYSFFCIWLLLLGSVVYPLKPQLELDRLLVLLGQCLSLPAGVAFARLFELGEDLGQKSIKMLSALACGFLFTGVLATAGIINNRSVEQYYFADNEVQGMREFLASYQTAGRVLFSGCVLHEFGGGHLAPLAYESGLPMVASSPTHTLWWYKDVIPAEFSAQGESGVNRFLDLYNISAVFAHDIRWQGYFNERPDQFRRVWKDTVFELYERINYESNYFLQGSGQILEQSAGGVRLSINSEEAVLKFRYSPALTAEGCTLSPEPITEGLRFVRLRCTPGRPVELKAMPPWKQLFLTGREDIF